MGVPLAPLTRYEIMPIQNADEYEVFWNTHDPRDVDD
jgi:sulfite oxidase